MTIKSLLLGSAAALAAVSGAQAADAIVAAEPEPMEYVKVCDAAGADHYFYIPGTETCLSISGFIRYRGDYNFQSRYYRGQFQHEVYVQAWNDSEYGDVYSFIRFIGSSANNSAMSTSVDGYFGIGGLEFGIFDNQWARVFGYGGAGITGGMYAAQANQYVSYTADLGSAKVTGAIDFIDANNAGYMAAVSGALGDWNAALGFAYDTTTDGFTIKGSAAGDLGIASVKLMAFYANKANYYTGFWNGGTGFTGFSILGSVAVHATDTVDIYGVAQWMQSPSRAWIAGGVNWAVTSGFDVQTEINYSTQTKSTNGIFRIRRSF